MLGGVFGLAVGSPVAGLVAASVLCLLYIVAGRRWVRARLKRPGIHTNTDALIGQRALVTQVDLRAPARPGARCATRCGARVPPPARPRRYEPGTEVIVEGVDGVTLLVRRS